MSYNSPLASTTNYGVVEIGSGINVTNGVISVVGNNIMNTVLVNNAASPYAVTATDEYIGAVGTGVDIDIDLPLGIDGTTVIIKSEFGNLSDVNVNPNGAETIDGLGIFTILSVTEGSITLVFRGTNWNVV
jgi:hypothetical protein